MSDFEYLSVLIAVIVGIGIAHLLLSIGRVIGQTKRLNVGAVHLIWTFNIISLLIAYWWWGINLRELEEWVFLQFYFILGNTALWCLLAAILFPVSIPPEFDLNAYFAEKRKSFFYNFSCARIHGPSDRSGVGNGTSTGSGIAVPKYNPHRPCRWTCSYSV